MARFHLLGAGPPGAPAGLFLEYGHVRLGFDGGPGSEPPEHIQAWLVCVPSEPLRLVALQAGMPVPVRDRFERGSVHVLPLEDGTGAWGYRVICGQRLAVWAPGCRAFPEWAEGADLMFAPGDPAIARLAGIARVRRLITLGHSRTPFGERAREGALYRL